MKIEDKKRKKVLIIIVAIVLFVGMTRVLFFGGEEFDYKTTTDPEEIVDLSLELEDRFDLENVRIAEAEGNVLEVRVETPTDVSEEALLMGTAYVLDYVEARVSEGIQKIRVIFTVNYLDAMFVEAQRQDIKEWREGKISANDLIQKFKIVQLSGGE